MQTNLKTTLSHLVSFPSISANSEACHEILEFVRSQIEPYRLHILGDTNRSNPWFLATTKDTKEPDVLFAAHLDVVPAPTALFTLENRDGKLYGRGTYDMKYAAACYIELIKNNIEQLRDLNVGFLFTTDEEIGGDSLIDILESGLRPKVVFIPDGGDSWKIEERAKGFHDVKITAVGHTSHGSRPWEGSNALHRLLDVIAILRKEYPSGEPSGPTLAITVMNSGHTINQVPDHAEAQMDFRTFSKLDIEAFKQHLRELEQTHDVTVEATQFGTPLNFDKHAPVVQDFLKTLRETTGKDPEYCESYGGTDGRYFAMYNIPCIILTPSGAGRHSANEWVLAEDLSNYYQLIEHWLFKN